MLHVTMLSIEFNFQEYVCQMYFVSLYYACFTFFSPGKAVAINDATSTHLQRLHFTFGWLGERCGLQNSLMPEHVTTGRLPV